MDKIEKLLLKLEKAENVIDELYSEFFEKNAMSHEIFNEKIKNARHDYHMAYGKYRMLKIPEFYADSITDGDIIMNKFSFVQVLTYCFVNSDGIGKYVRDGKESDIEILPSDVMYNLVRDDFDTIVWYNK